MGRSPSYTKEEDEIVLYYMRGITAWEGAYGDVRKRCTMIATKLPGRNRDSVRKRWYQLIADPTWKDEIQNLSDLLSPEQKKRIRTRVPSFKNIKVIR